MELHTVTTKVKLVQVIFARSRSPFDLCRRRAGDELEQDDELLAELLALNLERTEEK